MQDENKLLEKLAYYEQRDIEREKQFLELTDFMENASIPMHWVGHDGTILWANQAELDSLGYTKEEYVGQPIRNFHADEDIIKDILDRLSNNETLYNYKARLKCRDESIKYVLINSNVYRNAGKFIHTRCITRDITPLVEEENRKNDLLHKLEERDARLRMAIESTRLGTWDYNPATGELNWSDECKKIHGRPLEGGISFDEFQHHIYPEDRNMVLRQIEDSLNPALNNNYDVIFRIIRFNDNSIRWVRSQGQVYFTSERNPNHFFGTVIDITDLKLAEERSAKLAAIVESTDDAIVSKTLDSIITSWNLSAERMFGYEAGEMIGESILKIIPPDRTDEEVQILTRLKKGERVDHFETQRLTKSGKLLDVSLTISPVKNSKGEIIGLSKIARDITDKKQEENRKNDFVAMVSHELKTPITVIQSYVQVLLAKARKEQDAFSLKALARTELQTKKMTSMIENFLILARLGVGKIQIKKEVFDLLPLIAEVADDTRFLTSTHHVHVDELDSVLLNADKDKIGQVLINLLSNAIKYSSAGSIITLGAKKKEGIVLIYVRDQGIGISQKEQQNLFDRFYRVENDKIKMISGFGIGLYLVAEILRNHNSKIEVESEEGVGSTFYFSLPVFEGVL